MLKGVVGGRWYYPDTLNTIVGDAVIEDRLMVDGLANRAVSGLRFNPVTHNG